MYIVFEGLVGAGKTTQHKLYIEYLKKKFPDREIVGIREPGSTVISESIRTLVQATDFEENMDAVCEAYLYAGARAQVVQTIIRPALARGAIVVSDRSFWSSLTYQGFAKEIGIDKIREINKPIVSDLLADYVVFFDIPVMTGLSRTFDSSGDKHEKNGSEFFEKVYEGYHYCLKRTDFAKKSLAIDARGTPEEVLANIISQINI